MTDNAKPTALRITGDTLNKIIHIDPTLLELPLGDLWNNYYVQDWSTTVRKKQKTISCVMPAETFYQKFRFTAGRQPRYHFAEIEEI